jgi:ABC-type Fe3+-hydroxamate transport system substrate-binding protein
MDFEKVSNLVDTQGVTAIITADNRTYVTNESTFEAAGVDVIRIMPSAVDTTDYMQTVLMIAFLFDAGQGYMQKCTELIQWYEDFFTDLNNKLSHVKDKVSAVTASSNNAISSNTSDYTNVLLAAGATYPLDGIDWGGSASKTYDVNNGDTWLNSYDIDYIIPIRTSVDVTGVSASAPSAFSWYGGTALTDGKATLSLYMSYFRTTQSYHNDDVYIVCGDMPVVLRIAYVAEVLYPDAVGENFAYNYNLEFVEKFFGWNEDAIKGKPFCVSMSDLGITP